ncbi:MAG: TauD/TfdA family dioxygenase [Alphaproteobacteria bacterium]|nr:TauD/TfdA family dioxygenase [Alphaproteobacteria bacterium]
MTLQSEMDPAEIDVAPSDSVIGAEIRGVDLSHPIGDAVFARIHDAFLAHSVIYLRGQQLSPENLIDFSSRFGTLDIHHLVEHTLPGHPEVRVLSNVKKDGKPFGVAKSGRHWHSDLSYKEAPASATVLYGVETPPAGADTLFADMYAAYAALPDPLRRQIAGRRAMHDRNFRYSQMYPDRPPLSPEQLAAVPPTPHPAVRTHPETGRPSLFLARDVVSGLEGMDDEAARRLVAAIEEFATEARFVYAHKWQQGDVVIWDNRCTLHRATPFPDTERRVMYRTQIKGDRPVFRA